MGPKKKAGGAQVDEDDDSVDKFWKYYKNKCKELTTDVNKRIKQMYEEEYLEEQKALTRFIMWDECGWQGIRALMDALIQAKY